MPRLWDSRECPGPISEATLHRPSASRALTAGAIALAVVTPALEPVEQANAALLAPIRTEPVRAESAALDHSNAFATRAVLAQRASRATIRRAAGVRPGVTPASRRPTRPTARTIDLRTIDQLTARQTKETSETGETRTTSETSVTNRTAGTHRAARVTRPARNARTGRARYATSRKTIRSARTTPTRRPVARTVVTRHAAPSRQRVMRLGNMTAVIAYARSQVGKRYVSGGEGAGGFDCSGLTKQAYAKAGIRLPHSSRSQAARARRISRSQARPGDLVVGPGHVGIYMGNGMMIDAGNHRTGVVYRKLYSGLSVERL
jgi:peptidoglycan DL-endopeptidase CwlO